MALEATSKKAALGNAFVAWLSEQAESTEDKFRPFSSAKEKEKRMMMTANCLPNRKLK